MKGCVLVIWMALFHFNVIKGDDLSKVTEFDVKPGGETHVFEDTLGKFSCKFTYASQGGTKEQWVMTMNRDSEDSEVTCLVERPESRSYLFFLNFKVEILGATIQDVDIESIPRLKLPKEEYVVDKKENFVSSQTGKFKSQLRMVEVYGRRFRGEL